MYKIIKVFNIDRKKKVEEEKKVMTQDTQTIVDNIPYYAGFIILFVLFFPTDSNDVHDSPINVKIQFLTFETSSINLSNNDFPIFKIWSEWLICIGNLALFVILLPN